LFFERHEGGERAILVHLEGQDSEASEDPQEFQELAMSAGADMVAFFSVPSSRLTAKFLIGSGKVEELRDQIKAAEADLVIFNHTLTPSQERNLERAFECRVLDRTGLILDIFAQRARTHEGKLQVDLARLHYLSTRLVRRWSHLERQSGGIGMRGGPGETQIELDRRMIGDAIKRTRERLDKVKKQRQTQRRQRERRGTFNISLVGYTNAGKSSLFNALVKARTYAADQLFATLDTTTRQMYLGDVGRSISLSDTVGFIRDLPHTLVDAFAATLQEARDADLLLHVVDASNPAYPEQMDNVMKVLREIDAADVPQILVFNKLDALPQDKRPAHTLGSMELEGQERARIFVSALSGEGLDTLRTLLATHVADWIETQKPLSDPAVI